MTNVVFWPDVSHYQVNDQFNRLFLMYKVSEGTSYVDPSAAANGAWCLANSGKGKKLVGWAGTTSSHRAMRSCHRCTGHHSSAAPAEPWVGWQYTDGSTTWPTPAGWPRSSAPFGNCDHNAYYGTLQQFAAEYGIPAP